MNWNDSKKFKWGKPSLKRHKKYLKAVNPHKILNNIITFKFEYFCSQNLIIRVIVKNEKGVSQPTNDI